MRSNNAPDVVLNLTHEQATFMLKNAQSNHRLCLAIIMSMANEDTPIELKQTKAEPIVALQSQFTEMMRLLRSAGAQEPDDNEEDE